MKNPKTNVEETDPKEIKKLRAMNLKQETSSVVGFKITLGYDTVMEKFNMRLSQSVENQ